jgi:hypothetical protein
LIRKPLRIKASITPPQRKHRAAEGEPEGARAQSLGVEEWRRLPLLPSFLSRTKAATRGFLGWKKTREENQIKDDPKKIAASGASAAH